MEYRELPAERALADEVACVWYDNRVRSPQAHRAQLVMPDGCIDIVWMRGREPMIAGPATPSWSVARTSSPAPIAGSPPSQAPS
jgi:hypothetical protein